MWTWRTPFWFDRTSASRGAVWFFVLLALTSTGCGSRRGTDLLEARLRDQEDQLTEMQQQVASVAAERDRREREIGDLRKRLNERGTALPVPEQSEALFRVVGISINTLLSGGADLDDQPGDETLSVLISPHDEQNDLVKLPGTVELSAYDMTLPEEERRLGSWTFEAEKTRENWHRGLAGAGFLFQVPWEKPPSSEEVLVHVRFTTIDGRQFDKTETVRVEPVVNSVPTFTDTAPVLRPPPEPRQPSARRKILDSDSSGRVRLSGGEDENLFE